MESDEPPSPFFLKASQISSLLSYPLLINHLRHAFLTHTTFSTPPRHHHTIHHAPAPSTLLLMPSWSQSPTSPYLGVKIVTVFPENGRTGLPAVAASYLLSSSITGQPICFMDGKEITLWRTACVSALAAHYLARHDAEVLVMVGAGAMAPYLIKAHLSARASLRRILVWNRSPARAEALVSSLKRELKVDAIETCWDLGEAVRAADVVTCATLSEQPLVLGSWLKRGAHLDLVGSFTPGMRECDDEAMAKGRIFVDTEKAWEEAGELVGAMERKVITREDVVGTLAEMVVGDGEKEGRQKQDEITVFKSVGSAMVDLATAQLIYERYMQLNNG